MALHLIAEDPTPDEPTVPEPSVCDLCDGEGTLPIVDLRPDANWAVIGTSPCSGCCCEICGQPTETPPICARCDVAQDAAYERGQDV